MDRLLKQPEQNILDYLLTNYGDIKYLFEFMLTNSILTTTSFVTDGRRKYTIKPVQNAVLDKYKEDGIIVVTGGYVDPSDFNYDFSLDFLS